MTDDLITTLLGKAAEGGGAKLVELIYEDGRRLLVGKRGATAVTRINETLLEIRSQVQKLEAQGRLNRALRSQAFDEPAFAALVIKTMKAAAETPHTTAHRLLGAVVAERMISETGGENATLCGLACEAIAQATPLHLETLGSLATITLMNPTLTDRTLLKDDRLYLPDLHAWFERHMEGFPERYPHPGTIGVLVTMNCLRDRGVEVPRSDVRPGGAANVALFSKYEAPFQELRQWRGGTAFVEFLHSAGGGAALTPVGMLIGALVVNMRRGTDLSYHSFDDSAEFRFRSSHPRAKVFEPAK